MIILIYFFCLNFLYILFTLLSMIGIYRHLQQMKYINYKDLFQLPQIKPISIIAPAYNEENTIIESIHSLLALEYPQMEVIVVNDGSKDATMDRLVSHFGLKKTNRVFRKVIDTQPIKGMYTSTAYPKLVLIDKENGRKADALNAGLNVARYPLFCAIDGDSILEKDSLLKIARPFLEDPEKMVAAGGIIRLSNGCQFKSGQVINVRLPRSFVARFQIIEYFRAFLGGRLGMNMLRSMLIISGAFGLFRKDIALLCGGYRAKSIGEDIDLIIRMKQFLHKHRIHFRISYIPDPICWTEAPESFRDLTRQRSRWQRGLIQSMLYGRKMLFNPRYGVTGLFAMPFYVIFEMLGPLIEVLGYIIFISLAAAGRINTPFMVMFFLFAVALGIILSLLAVVLEEFSIHPYPRLKDVSLIVLFSGLENFIYRQYLSVVRFKAFFDYLLGKNEWGEMKKKGFTVAD